MKRLLLSAIRFYRRAVSPLFPPRCRYIPTCSQYALEAVEKYGAAKGGWLAFKRLMRCHPFHHHKGGWIRGVLHRGCNALLGKIENNWRRVGVPHLGTFLGGAFGYLESTEVPAIEVFHPSYRTPEEKRLLRNKRARRKRKAKKSAATT